MAEKKTFKTGVLLGHIELTEKQKNYLSIMLDPSTKVVFLSGCAGTGKSILGLYASLALWNKDKSLKIKYLRTAVESSERSVGFLKGDINQKAEEYYGVLHDKMSLLLNAQERDEITKKKVIEEDLINWIRGQDWRDKVVIADEFQNFSKKEMVTCLSRMNKNTRVFACGDAYQSDIKNPYFKEICDLFDDEDSRKQGIHVLRFGKEDVMRDGVIGFILDKIEGQY